MELVHRGRNWQTIRSITGLKLAYSLEKGRLGVSLQSLLRLCVGGNCTILSRLINLSCLNPVELKLLPPHNVISTILSSSVINVAFNPLKVDLNSRCTFEVTTDTRKNPYRNIVDVSFVIEQYLIGSKSMHSLYCLTRIRLKTVLGSSTLRQCLGSQLNRSKRGPQSTFPAIISFVTV